MSSGQSVRLTKSASALRSRLSSRQAPFFSTDTIRHVTNRGPEPLLSRFQLSSRVCSASTTNFRYRPYRNSQSSIIKNRLIFENSRALSVTPTRQPDETSPDQQATQVAKQVDSTRAAPQLSPQTPATSTKPPTSPKPKSTAPSWEQLQKDLIQTTKTALHSLYIFLNTRIPTHKLTPPSENHFDVSLLGSELYRLNTGLFSLVVCGEYNSGKSTFINTLLNHHLLKQGPLPTTSEITFITGKGDDDDFASGGDRDGRYINDFEERNSLERVKVIEFDHELLRTTNIVDTPGTNSLNENHTVLTQRFIPRSDLIVFITSADRVLTLSEKKFLDVIKGWRKRVVVAVNKVDVLEEGEVESVLKYVRDVCAGLLGKGRGSGSGKVRSQALLEGVFGMSSKMGFEGKRLMKESKVEHGEALWRRSGVDQIEQVVVGGLRGYDRFCNKMSGVIGVGRKLIDKHEKLLEYGLREVEREERVLRDIDTLLGRYENEIRAGFDHHYRNIDLVLLDMLNRSDVFIDNCMIGRDAWKLLYGKAVAQEYEAAVVRGVEKRLERYTRELGDWIVARVRDLVSESVGIFGERRNWTNSSSANSDIVKAVNSENHSNAPLNGLVRKGSGNEQESARFTDNFHNGGSAYFDEEAVRRALSVNLQEVMQRYGSYLVSEKESEKIGQAVSRATSGAFAAELGALGMLGALVQTSSFDLASLGATTTVAGLGLLLLPRRRRRLKQEIRSRVDGIRERVLKEMREEVRNVVAREKEKFERIVKPYEEGVKRRREMVEKDEAELSTIKRQVEGIVARLRLIEPKSSTKRSEG